MEKSTALFSDQYDERLGTLKAVKSLKKLLKELCKSTPDMDDPPYEGPPNIIRVEARIKDKKSYLDKIRRPTKSYKDPINEITDLVGFRIITYYNTDILKVVSILKKEFEIIEEIDARERLATAEFGYLSRHFIVKMSANRLVNTEYKKCGDQKFEIQVRTLLQHAWATLSHKLTYKAGRGIPRQLERDMASFSSLLERADKDSVELQKLRRTIREEYIKRILKRDFNMETDVESVRAYVENAETVKTWWIKAREIGWQESIIIPKEHKELLLFQNSELTNIILLGGIRYIHELNEILIHKPKTNEDYLFRLYKSLAANGEHLFADVHDIIRAIIIYNKNKMIKAIDLRDLGYSDSLVRIYSDICDLKDD